jgi:hypothetical protein
MALLERPEMNAMKWTGFAVIAILNEQSVHNQKYLTFKVFVVTFYEIIQYKIQYRTTGTVN